MNKQPLPLLSYIKMMDERTVKYHLGIVDQSYEFMRDVQLYGLAAFDRLAPAAQFSIVTSYVKAFEPADSHCRQLAKYAAYVDRTIGDNEIPLGFEQWQQN